MTRYNYAKTVTLADNLDVSERIGDTDLPTHVTCRVLIDGMPVAGVADIDVSYGRQQATIVTMDVLASLVGPPFLTSEGEWVPGCIDGHAVLTPKLDHMPWDVVTNYSSDYPLANTEPLIRCHFYPARVVLE